MTGGVEVPSMEVPGMEPVAEQTPEPATKPATRRKTAKAKGDNGLPATVAETTALIEALRAEAADLGARYFQGAAHRSAAPMLEAATRAGRRDEHLREAATAAYRSAWIFGATSILGNLRRLLEADAIEAEAVEVEAAAARADAAAAALGLDATRTAAITKAIRGVIATEADGLRKRASHMRTGVRLDPERVDLNDEATWPGGAQQDARHRRAALLRLIEQAREIA